MGATNSFSLVSRRLYKAVCSSNRALEQLTNKQKCYFMNSVGGGILEISVNTSSS
jgi:hypothetical protein